MLNCLRLLFLFVYYRYSCAIPDGDTVIITGGEYTLNIVSVYTVEGWQKDLPPLNNRRYYHACSRYLSDERKVRKYQASTVQSKNPIWKRTIFYLDLHGDGGQAIR